MQIAKNMICCASHKEWHSILTTALFYVQVFHDATGRLWEGTVKSWANGTRRRMYILDHMCKHACHLKGRAFNCYTSAILQCTLQ